MQAEQFLKIPNEIYSNWQNIVDDLAQFMNTDIAFITHIENDILTVIKINTHDFRTPQEGDEFDLHGIFCEKTIQGQSYHIVPNAKKDPEWSSAHEIEIGFISYLGFPLRWPTGEIYGTICVNDQEEQDYTEYKIRMLEHFKNLVESQLKLLYKNNKLEKINKKLIQSKMKIRNLEKILPICSNCKKIRDDKGNWHPVEKYIRTSSGKEITHGLCNDCYNKLYKKHF